MRLSKTFHCPDDRPGTFTPEGQEAVTYNDWDSRLLRYPAELSDRYASQGMWSDIPTAERFHRVASKYPKRPAVIAPDGQMSYEELDIRTDQIAAGLHNLGLTAGEPVLFQLENALSSILAWYATLKAGLIPVATLAAHRQHEIGTISTRVGAVAHIVNSTSTKFDFVDFASTHATSSPTMRLVLTTGRSAPASDPVVSLDALGAEIDPASARQTVKRIQSGIAPEDIAVFQLSGGTTGTPKVIPRIHAEYWNNALFYSQRLARTEAARVAHVLPFIHNAGIVCAVHGAHSVGGCLVLPPTTPDSALDFMISAGVTDFLLVTAYAKILQNDAAEVFLNNLDTLIFAGSKLPEWIFDTATRRDVWVGQLFGMAEGFFATSHRHSPPQARQLCVGSPLTSSDELRILNPSNEDDVPEGETGEVACRGPYTIRGYFDADEHNRGAFTSDGFYRTGDLGRILRFDCAYLSIEGRIKDVVSRGGEKINAEEVELLLLQHEAIADAAIVAMPDQRLGERACAYLVAAAAPVDLSVIQQHFQWLGVAKFKWPERIEWVETIPRTHVSKIDKAFLRKDIARIIETERRVSNSEVTAQ
jgi:2,3-dihydroxybenzoate-AMP ligase